MFFAVLVADSQSSMLLSVRSLFFAVLVADSQSSMLDRESAHSCGNLQARVLADAADGLGIEIAPAAVEVAAWLCAAVGWPALARVCDCCDVEGRKRLMSQAFPAINAKSTNTSVGNLRRSCDFASDSVTLGSVTTLASSSSRNRFSIARSVP